MATLYINYFGGAQFGVASGIGGNTTITTSGTSAASSAIPGGTQIVGVSSDVAHYVTVGTGTPTAIAGAGFYLPAGGTREFRVDSSGAALKIAAITA